jgi:hypothetical protein
VGSAGASPDRTSVTEAMTEDVCCCFEDHSVEAVERRPRALAEVQPGQALIRKGLPLGRERRGIVEGADIRIDIFGIWKNSP